MNAALCGPSALTLCDDERHRYNIMRYIQCNIIQAFARKSIFIRIIMQLSTLVLKEDNSPLYYKHLSRVEVHVKFVLADYKAISYHVGLCRSKNLPTPFELGSQTGNYTPPPQHVFCHLYFFVAIP